MGIWKPRDIPNPEYFELERPNIEPIAAIDIEIWTMQDGILFDNVLIAKDEKVAETYRQTTWKPKFDVEKEKQKAEDEAAGEADGFKSYQKKVFGLLYKVADILFLSAYKSNIMELVEKAETQPNLTIGVLISVVVVFLYVFFKLIFGSAKVNVEKNKQESTTETSKSEAKTEKEEAAAAPRKRQTRRES